MIEAILEPNKAIAQHYENKLIQLADGRIHMGAITYKSEKEVVIRDSAQGGKEVKLLMTDVRKMKPMPSLMPAGLADQLKTRGEFLDLAKFVSVLGRPGPYANDESPVIRKWKIAPGSADKPPASDTPWVTAYSMVDGLLHDEDLGPDEIIYAQGAVDVQVAGSVKLQSEQPQGTEALDRRAPRQRPHCSSRPRSRSTHIHFRHSTRPAFGFWPPRRTHHPHRFPR